MNMGSPLEGAKFDLGNNENTKRRSDLDQWASLVTFWGSQEGVARSRRNSRNREARTMSHRQEQKVSPEYAMKRGHKIPMGRRFTG
ncbi:hypothetical protein AAC387_Pa03g0818 [Persea americana]